MFHFPVKHLDTELKIGCKKLTLKLTHSKKLLLRNSDEKKNTSGGCRFHFLMKRMESGTIVLKNS